MEKIRQENNVNIPNTLTVLRLVLIPFYAWRYLTDNLYAALTIYLVVQITDLLDGMIARRFRQVTFFGKLMDPLADKLLLLTVLGCFVIKGQLPWWVLALILIKEALMIIGSIFALRRDLIVQATLPGKAATLLFALAVVSILLKVQVLIAPLLGLAVLTSFAAFFIYAVRFLQTLKGQKA